MQPILTTPSQKSRVRTKTVQPCTHSRMVDDVRNASGAKTGQIACQECQAEFPDSAYQKPEE